MHRRESPRIGYNTILPLRVRTSFFNGSLFALFRFFSTGFLVFLFFLFFLFLLAAAFFFPAFAFLFFPSLSAIFSIRMVLP